MSQPTRQHRREIWSSLCIGYDVVSDILWRQALAAGQHVGVCGNCGQPMKPRQPEQRGARTFYPAQCLGCDREVEGMGPRPAKPGKGGA